MPGKKVLLYYPPNNRSIAIETLCRAVQEGGHELIVLTLTEKGPFHAALEKKGIRTYSYVLPRKSSSIYFMKHARHLKSFCRQHAIDFVWSHLQEGNFIAVLARLFGNTKLVTFRHHAESVFYAEFGKKFGLKRNRKEIFLDRVINRFSPKLVVPSSEVWTSMEKYEGCNMRKVLLLPYIYDFSNYEQPQLEKVDALRKEYSSKLLLIMVSRLIPTKQHKTVFEVMKKLINEGLSIKMLVMDDGPLRAELETFIASNQLTDKIILTGYRQDFVNYMAAADLLIHPSVSEASNNVVKEMGLLEKAVAVCRNVGDFSDYIKDDCNGYFLERNDLEKTIESTIRDAYEHPEKLKQFGRALKQEVLLRFEDSAVNRERFLSLLQ